MQKIGNSILVLAIAAITYATTVSADDTVPTQNNPTNERQKMQDSPYGGADKSYDTELLKLRELIAPKFQTLKFDDAVTGKTMTYSLFTPDDYDKNKSYPLVLFMADGSTTGKGPEAPLKQGYGGIIWATPESQARNPSFVLVPSYVGPKNVVNDQWEASYEVDMTLRLLDSVASQYNIDKNRLYTTGQSMGGMMSFYFDATHPDLFAASLFVGSQWDIKVLAPLAKEKFFYIVSAGDAKASAGMRELGAMLKEKGVVFGSTEFSAKLPNSEQNQKIEALIKEGHEINFVQFSAGTVLPVSGGQGMGPGGEHMYSFDYAYQLEAVRDWLFQQTKDVKSGEKEQSAQGGKQSLAKGVGRPNLELGIKYLNGTDVKQDYSKSAELFNLAWQQGDMKAPRYLGIIYEEGLGVKTDYAEALRFYKAAAAAGDITAAARIGSLYERGLGVKQSYQDALNWYLTAAPTPEEAAKNAYPRHLALIRLGYFYETGLGVKKDVDRAISWYRVAAINNDLEAKAALERLSSVQASN